MASMQSSRTAQLLADLDGALTWMRSLGVEIDPERHAAYRKMLEKWDDFVAGRGKLGMRELHPIMATFAYEAPALIQIHRSFGACPPAELAGLAAQLSAATRGPIRIIDPAAAAGHPARDALFHARAAAYVQQVAHEGRVPLAADGSATFAHGRHQFYIAAERLRPDAGIQDSIRTACARLVTALDGRQRAKNRGLVVLDASALVRWSAPGPALPTQARASMDGAADQLLAEFIDAQMNALQDALRGMDRRIIGVLTLLSSAAVADDDQAVVHVGRWVLVWRDHINFTDYEVLERLRDLMRAAQPEPR